MSELRIKFTGNPDRLERLAKLAKDWSIIFGASSAELEFIEKPIYFPVEDIKNFIDSQEDASVGMAERTTSSVRRFAHTLEVTGKESRLGLPENETPYDPTGALVHRSVIGFCAINYHQIDKLGVKGAELLGRFLVQSSGEQPHQE